MSCLKFFIFLFLFAALYSIISCSPVEEQRQDYMISIINVSGFDIKDAHVIYDNFISVGGIISSKSRSSHLYPELPIPDKAIVQWRTHDDKFHELEVEVRRVVPEKIKVEIIFEITDGNEVVVKSKPWK